MPIAKIRGRGGASFFLTKAKTEWEQTGIMPVKNYVISKRVKL